MSLYVDTSAFLAVLDSREERHSAARAIWHQLIQTDEQLVVNNYVLVETCAVVQNRLGLPALNEFQRAAAPLLHIDWIGESGQAASLAALLVANQQRLSLVDCTSFYTIRRLGLERVFTFDQHFREQGFTCLP